MPVFVIIPLANNAAALRTAMATALTQSDVLELQNSAGFLVRYEGTSVELSNAIGLTSADKNAPSTTGSALVCSMGSYYGRGPTTMWEWIQTRLEGAS